MAGITQGTGWSQQKVQNCLLLTLNLTTCLFLVFFSKKNYTAFTFVLLFLMRRTFASQRRTPWIVILVFSGTFFEVSWIISQCFVPVTWLKTCETSCRMKSTFGKNIIMLILKQGITFNLRFPILMSAKIKLRSESRTGVDGQKRTFENTFEELTLKSAVEPSMFLQQHFAPFLWPCTTVTLPVKPKSAWPLSVLKLLVSVECLMSPANPFPGKRIF